MTIRIKAIVLAVCLSPTTLLANFEARWLVPQTGTEELYAGALRDSGIIKDALQLDALDLTWSDTVVLSMGGSGLPRFVPSTQTIHIPYNYLAEAVRAQSNFEESSAIALQRGLDVVEYSLYHLLAHALLGSHSVDVDETAEQLSTWMMLKTFSNGGEQWLEDVEAFSRASQKLDGPLEDYWHDHGLSKRAAQRLNCLVIGSDPQSYLSLYPGLAESTEKTAACVEDWRMLEELIESKFKSKTQ